MRDFSFAIAAYRAFLDSMRLAANQGLPKFGPHSGRLVGFYLITRTNKIQLIISGLTYPIPSGLRNALAQKVRGVNVSYHEKN